MERVELYLWGNTCHFEPEYAVSRMLVAKQGAMASLLDDTFDAYGKLDELQRFADAFERLLPDTNTSYPSYLIFIDLPQYLYMFVQKFFALHIFSD